MKFFSLLIVLIFLSACGNYQSNLDQLGVQNNFSDVDIPADFIAPEDEPEVVLPIVEEEEEIILPPEGGITPPPVQVSLKNTFLIESREYSLAHGPAYRWDGCNQSKMTQGGYNSDTNCSRAFFHPAFVNNLQDDFFVCVHSAALEAGYPEPRKVFIRHVGTYNDRPVRNGTRLSNHAYARAWDITNFNLFDIEGNSYRVSTYLRDYEGSQAVFYDEFRACWMASLPSSCGPGNSEYKGSIGHQASELGGNSLHNDHLHLSYPLCAGNS